MFAFYFINSDLFLVQYTLQISNLRFACIAFHTTKIVWLFKAARFLTGRQQWVEEIEEERENRQQSEMNHVDIAGACPP